MRRRSLFTVAFLFVACPLKTLFAAQIDWPDALAKSFAAQTVLTNLNLAGQLAPVIRFSQAPCRTAQVPDDSSVVAVITSVVIFGDDAACNRSTDLILLQVSLSASPSQLDRLKALLSARLPAACFDGDMPTDPRRHAPVRHLLIWTTPARIVTFGTEAGDSTTAAVTLLQWRPSTFETTTAEQAWSTFVAGLPKPCR